MVVTPGVLATCIPLLSLPDLTEITIRTKGIEEEIVKDFSDFLFIYLFIFIYFWLCWVFVSARGLSVVVVSGDHSSSRCTGLSLLRPLFLRSTGSRHAGSVIVAHRPSCLCGMWDLPRPGLEPVSPALAGRFSTTVPPGKPFSDFLKDRMCGVLMALVEQRQCQVTGKLTDVGKLWRGSRHGGYQLLQKAEVK